MNSLNKGGIGVLIDSMVEEIIDDIVTERLSNVHNTMGPSASDAGHPGLSSYGNQKMPFATSNEYGRVSGIRLGQGGNRQLYEAEEDN